MTSAADDPATQPSPPTPPSTGERLQAARQARGWSVQEVAGRLRLRAALVEALERNDHALFGAATYARGQTRNYARLLGLDAQLMLQGVPPAAGDGPNRHLSRAPELHPVRPWLVRLGGLAILGTLAVLGVLWGGVGREPSAVSPRPETARALDTPPSMPGPAPAPAPTRPVATRSDAAGLDRPDTTSDVTPTGSVPTASESPPVAPAEESLADAQGNPTSSVVLRARAISWVEVTDRTGRRLVYELIKPGSERVVSGEPPLRLLLGNAPAVHVLYNGAPVSLPAGRQVVSLTLGEATRPADQVPQNPPSVANP